MMAGATSQLFQGFTSIEPFENVKASFPRSSLSTLELDHDIDID